MNPVPSRDILFMKQDLKIHFVSELLHTVQEEIASEVYTAELILKNQILVSKNPPGMTDGDESNNLKQVELIPGQHSALSEDGAALRAMVTGYPFMQNKGSDIKVSGKQTISRDVDFSVGNIESKDCVDIKGNVLPGFNVKTKGDLRIGGSIEDATIAARVDGKRYSKY
jgi:hypothetical protein